MLAVLLLVINVASACFLRDSKFPCWTPCTKSKKDRACEKWGRTRTDAKSRKCETVVLGKSLYKWQCSPDPKYPQDPSKPITAFCPELVASGAWRGKKATRYCQIDTLAVSGGKLFKENAYKILRGRNCPYGWKTIKPSYPNGPFSTYWVEVFSDSQQEEMKFNFFILCHLPIEKESVAKVAYDNDYSYDWLDDWVGDWLSSDVWKRFLYQSSAQRKAKSYENKENYDYYYY